VQNNIRKLNNNKTIVTLASFQVVPNWKTSNCCSNKLD